MSSITKSFTATGSGNDLYVGVGKSFIYNASGATITGAVRLEYTEDGVSYTTAESTTATAATLALSGVKTNNGNVPRRYRFTCTSYTSGTITAVLSDVEATSIVLPKTAIGGMEGVGVVNQPSSGVIGCSVSQIGNLVTLDFTLDKVRLTVTDAAGSGSSGSHKLFDFDNAIITPIAAFQNYTGFVEGSALTGGAGDAAFVMGLGSAACNAGDAALTSTEVDFGAVTGTITLSGGTGTGKKAGITAITGLDGSSTAIDLYLNWSGSAATIDATSTIDVTGTLSVTVLLQHDV